MVATISIEPAKGRKGRTFRAHLLNYLLADRAWDSGAKSNAKRPVYLAYAATDQEAQAFTANLRTGRKAIVRNDYGQDRGRIELLKSAGYRFVLQRTGGTTIVTAFLPALFELDPGLLEESISFLWAPPTWWVERQLDSPALEGFPEDERRELVLAGHFAAFLDRRTPLPILNEPKFHRQLYRAARREPWFIGPSGCDHRPGTLYVFPEERLVGLELAALVQASHASFEELLRVETTTYYETEVPRHGTTRIPGRRRLLPDSRRAPTQLSLLDLLEDAA